MVGGELDLHDVGAADTGGRQHVAPASGGTDFNATYLGRPRHEIWIRREICPVLVLDPNTVIRSSVEVRPGKTDSVTLCDLDDLGRVIAVGVTIRVVGRRQDPTRW